MPFFVIQMAYLVKYRIFFIPYLTLTITCLFSILFILFFYILIFPLLFPFTYWISQSAFWRLFLCFLVFKFYECSRILLDSQSYNNNIKAPDYFSLLITFISIPELDSSHTKVTILFLMENTNK